jgi:hypothetical protein
MVAGKKDEKTSQISLAPKHPPDLIEAMENDMNMVNVRDHIQAPTRQGVMPGAHTTRCRFPCL